MVSATDTGTSGDRRYSRLVRAVAHIGFHKTATTTLQFQLFPALRDVVLVTRDATHGPPGYLQYARGLCKLDRDRYDEEGLRRYLEGVAPQPPGTLLLSDEGLSGTPYLGASRWRPSLERLRGLLPWDGVLVVVRSQPAMWRSLYANYVGRGGTASFSTFAADRAPGFQFDLDYLRYDVVVEEYQRAFGAERVRVLPYELLAADPMGFAAAVTEFVLGDPGAPPPTLDLGVMNRSLGRRSRDVTRVVNRLFRSSRFNPRPVLGDRRVHEFSTRVLRRLDPVVFRGSPRPLGSRDQRAADGLAPAYEESNARLESLIGCSLRPFGYPLPARSGDAEHPVRSAGGPC
jgi:hypothetical protein